MEATLITAGEKERKKFLQREKERNQHIHILHETIMMKLRRSTFIIITTITTYYYIAR